MIAGLLLAAGGYLLIALACHVHAKVRAFLPEDPPGPRKPKPWPLPMVGWIVALAALAVLPFRGASWLWLLGLGLAVLAGAWDDFHKASGGLVWWRKGILLLLAAGCAAYGLGDARWFAIPLLFVVVNAVNFLDNTDGVALAVAALPLALVEPSNGGAACATLGALFLGVLPFNWPRGKVILGDAGAYALGIALGSAALVRPGFGEGAALLALPLVDFVQVVSARLWLGYAPWIADRRHLTHILVHSGLARVLVAPLFALLAVLLLGILRVPLLV